MTNPPPAPGPTYTVKVRVKADAPGFIKEVQRGQQRGDGNRHHLAVTRSPTWWQTDGVPAGQLLTGVVGENKPGPRRQPAGPEVLPDLRIKRLTACGGGDLKRSTDNNGMKLLLHRPHGPGHAARTGCC